MQNKTEAIVLKTLKYSENSLIVKLFTKESGLKSYIIGIGKKNNSKKSYFFALNLLDVVSFGKNNSQGLERITEVKFAHHYTSLHTDIIKISIIQFLNEVLYNCIKEESANLDIYEFVKTHLLYFDESRTIEKNFHLYFLIKLAKYLGFAPENNYTENSIFDLIEACFIQRNASPNPYLNSELSQLFYKLNQSNIDDIDQVKISTTQRRELIVSILLYYQMHLEGFKEIKSHKVLEVVLT